MKLYRTRTREQYDWLMNKLEYDFRRWESGELPTEYDGFHDYGENTVIEDDRESGWGVLYGHIKDIAESYPEVPTIEVSNLMEEQKMKIYEIDKMAFEYITKSLKSSFITISLQNEILDNLENNIELSEEEMSYLITAITFNKELVDSYRNVLIELLENPTEEFTHEMDRHTEILISEVMNDVVKILEYSENEQDMTKEEWNDFFNYELPNMVSKQQTLLKEMFKNENI